MWSRKRSTWMKIVVDLFASLIVTTMRMILNLNVISLSIAKLPQRHFFVITRMNRNALYINAWFLAV